MMKICDIDFMICIPGMSSKSRSSRHDVTSEYFALHLRKRYGNGDGDGVGDGAGENT